VIPEWGHAPPPSESEGFAAQEEIG
jgi:hypothetical protein